MPNLPSEFDSSFSCEAEVAEVAGSNFSKSSTDMASPLAIPMRIGPWNGAPATSVKPVGAKAVQMLFCWLEPRFVAEARITCQRWWKAAWQCMNMYVAQILFFLMSLQIPITFPLDSHCTSHINPRISRVMARYFAGDIDVNSIPGQAVPGRSSTWWRSLTWWGYNKVI